MCSNIIERLNLIVSTDSQHLWGHTHTVALLRLQDKNVWSPPSGPHEAHFTVLWSLYSKRRWDVEYTSGRYYICMLYEATTALCDPYSCQGSITKEKEHPLHDVISQAIKQLYDSDMPLSEVVNAGLLLWSQFHELTDRYSRKPHWEDSFFSALLRPLFMDLPLDSSIQCLQFHLFSRAKIYGPAPDLRKGQCIMQFFISQMTALAVQHTSLKALDLPEMQFISALGRLWNTNDGHVFGFWEAPAGILYVRLQYALFLTILVFLPEESGRKILQCVWKGKVQTANNRKWLPMFEEIVKGQWDSFFNELRKSHFRSYQFLMLLLVGEDGKTLDPDFRRVMVEVYPDRPLDYYDKPYDFAIEKKTSRLLKRYYQEHILVQDSSYPPNLVLDPNEENDFIISPFRPADSQPLAAVDINENELESESSGSAFIIDMGSSSP
jgi:hypothetical protein